MLCYQSKKHKQINISFGHSTWFNHPILIREIVYQCTQLHLILGAVPAHMLADWIWYLRHFHAKPNVMNWGWKVNIPSNHSIELPHSWKPERPNPFNEMPSTRQCFCLLKKNNSFRWSLILILVLKTENSLRPLDNRILRGFGAFYGFVTPDLGT